MNRHSTQLGDVKLKCKGADGLLFVDLEGAV